MTSSSSISPIDVLLVPRLAQSAQSAQSSLNVCYCAIMNKSESNDFVSSQATNNGASNAGTNEPLKPAYLYSTTSINCWFHCILSLIFQSLSVVTAILT